MVYVCKLIFIMDSVSELPTAITGTTFIQSNMSNSLVPRSKALASFRRASARNPRKAVSILFFLSGSDEMLRLAVAALPAKPSSPPKNSPPAEAKKYVAKSPNVEGFRRGVRSGIDLVRPSAKITLVGLSCARTAAKNALRVLRNLIAANSPSPIPTAEPTVVHRETVEAADLSL